MRKAIVAAVVLAALVWAFAELNDDATEPLPSGQCVIVESDGNIWRETPAEAERLFLQGEARPPQAVFIRRGNEVRTLDGRAEFAEAKAYGWSVTCPPK